MPISFEHLAHQVFRLLRDFGENSITTKTPIACDLATHDRLMPPKVENYLDLRYLLFNQGRTLKPCFSAVVVLGHRVL